MSALTLEQQKDIARRMQIGWQAASDDQAARVRARSDEEKWDAADRLLADWDHTRKRRTETSGMVEQQRLFSKLPR